MNHQECCIIEVEIAKTWDRMSKKMHVWEGGPGVPTLAYISSLSDKVNFSQIKTNLLDCKWSFHWPKQEGQNSILIVFMSGTSPGNIIWRIKGCVLQTLNARSLYLAVLITPFFKFRHRT